MARRKPLTSAASTLLGTNDDLSSDTPEFMPTLFGAVNDLTKRQPVVPTDMPSDQQRYAASDALLASHGMAPHEGGRQTIGPGNMARGKNAPPNATEINFLHALFGAIKAGKARRA